jgi:hypothetical protein
VLHPSGLPLACGPRMERGPLGFTLGFGPRSYPRRPPGRGRALSTGSELHLRHQPTLQSDAFTCGVRPRVAHIVRPRSADAALRALHVDTSHAPGSDRQDEAQRGEVGTAVRMCATRDVTAAPRAIRDRTMSNPPRTDRATLGPRPAVPLEPKSPSRGNQPAHIRLTTRRSTTDTLVTPSRASPSLPTCVEATPPDQLVTRGRGWRPSPR